MLACASSPDQATDDVDVAGDDSGSTHMLEISPGVGIGPVLIGGTYGDLKEGHGPPDGLVDYNRVFFATWLEWGLEVVMGSGSDNGLQSDSMVVSVGTKFVVGYSGVVTPGMTRQEADWVLGECPDVIDETHCYHPEGVYLAYDENGVIDAVAIHPPYTLRSQPPEMQAALGLGELR